MDDIKNPNFADDNLLMYNLFRIAIAGSYDEILSMASGRPDIQLNQIGEDGYTAFGTACKYGNLGAATALADLGVDINLCDRDLGGNPPLHAAIVGEHTDIIKFLLHRKVDISALGWMGVTGGEKLRQFVLKNPAALPPWCLRTVQEQAPDLIPEWCFEISSNNFQRKKRQ